MKSRMSTQSDVRRRIRGQGMTEYIIIVALIAVAAISAVGAFGGVVTDSFTAMATRLTDKKPKVVTVVGATEKAGNTEGTLGSF